MATDDREIVQATAEDIRGILDLQERNHPSGAARCRRGSRGSGWNGRWQKCPSSWPGRTDASSAT